MPHCCHRIRTAHLQNTIVILGLGGHFKQANGSYMGGGGNSKARLKKKFLYRNASLTLEGLVERCIQLQLLH